MSEAGRPPVEYLRTSFSTPESAERNDPEGEWYYVMGVRYCSRCETRRCKRQTGGGLECLPPERSR